MLRADIRDFLSSVLLALLTGTAASFLFAALVLLLAPEARADEGASGEGAYLVLRQADGTVRGTAPLVGTAVKMHFSGLVGRVTVAQRFRNPGEEWLEGIYVFPLPADSAVDHLQMRYDGRLVEGEIQPRAAARKVYREALADGRKAALLEQQRPNVFTTSVANIPPGAEIEVRIEYQQGVAWRDGAVELRFPLVVAPRYIPGRPLETATPGFGSHGWSVPTDAVPDADRITPPVAHGVTAPQNPVSIELDLDAGVPVGSLRSLNHAIRTERLSDRHYRIGLADGMVPADRDFVLQWRPAAGAGVEAALFHEKRDDAEYGMLMLVPPQPGLPVARVARELILVIDTSGSMHGESLRQAREALRLAVSGLGAGDRFNVIRFSNEAHALFAVPQPAGRDTVRAALDWVDGLEANGGTEMLGAMRMALRDEQRSGLLRQVVFLTDGAVGNERELFVAITRMLGRSRLFTVGIGSAPNSHFMERAARHGRGSHVYISDVGLVRERMRVLLDKLAAPVLTDITLHWPGDAQGPAQAPDPVGDLYRGEPLNVVFRATALPPWVEVRGHVAGRPWRHRVNLAGGAARRGVHVLWARRSIADWMSRAVLGEDPGRVRAEVTRIAMRHHLVSRYTSLVAVDRTPVRPPGTDVAQGQAPTRLPAGWSPPGMIGQLPQTATPAALLMSLGGGGVLLGLATLFGLRRRAG